MGTCHLQEFAERECERDTLIWPNKQWPQGRPSRAFDWKANVEVAGFASMPQREMPKAAACATPTRTNATPATAARFSAAESRQPEACATCHSGVNHNNWEAYSMSKHGKTVAIMGNKWNWNVPLKDAYSQGRADGPHLCGLPLRI